MAHEELNCKGLIINDGESAEGLHFVIDGHDGDDHKKSFDDLKYPTQIFGILKMKDNVLKEKIVLEQAIYFIIAAHSIVGIAFDPKSHDFLTYLRSYFIGGPSEKLTSKILAFKKAVPIWIGISQFWRCTFSASIWAELGENKTPECMNVCGTKSFK